MMYSAYTRFKTYELTISGILHLDVSLRLTTCLKLWKVKHSIGLGLL